MTRFLPLFIAGLFLLQMAGCYTFRDTGTGELKTVKVNFIENRAEIINPLLSQTFTEALKDKITRETNLTLVDAQADAEFSGYIVGYSTTPVAGQAGETAALTRFTITAKIEFTNTQEEQKNFNQNFAYYADFSSSTNFAGIENELAATVVAEIVDRIFQKAFVNW